MQTDRSPRVILQDQLDSMRKRGVVLSHVTFAPSARTSDADTLCSEISRMLSYHFAGLSRPFSFGDGTITHGGS